MFYDLNLNVTIYLKTQVATPPPHILYAFMTASDLNMQLEQRLYCR